MKITRQNPSGAYGTLQEYYGKFAPAGTIEITADTTEFFDGYIVPTIEDRKIVSFVEDTEAHKAWLDAEAAKPAVVAEPTEAEKLRADVDYLAVMAGVTL